MKAKRYNPLHILCGNGWEWLHAESQKLSVSTDYDQYRLTVLGATYASTVVAIVSCRPDHLDLDGHYGVLWLEAIYECQRDGCLSYEDMEDMQAAIMSAEENLLAIGMPFTEGYEFHGRNRANMKRRNERLRRMYGLEELEKEDL